MLWRMFTIASAVSLLLCIAASVLWVRSYWYTDDLRTDRLACAAAERWEDQRFELWTNPDVLSLNISRFTVTDPRYVPRFLELGEKARPFRGHQSGFAYLPAWRDPPRTAAERLGFHFERSDRSMPPFFAQKEITIALPLWLITALLSVFPVVWLARLGRRFSRRGLCATCGYDLRASPDRCPECGAAVVGAASAKRPGA